jgi:hypothetical protein
MILRWLFGGVDEQRDRELADKLIIGWEIDRAKVSPLMLKFCETHDLKEKGIIATTIAWHIDCCFKDYLAAFDRVTNGVPKDKVGGLKLTQAIKKIADQATEIHAQMDPHIAILMDEEAGNIILELELSRRR